MTFSVAITTYNRPNSVANLVKQVRACTLLPAQILVVDSSDQLNETINSDRTIIYIRSSHKNQPYQRYLAYRACKSDAIIFLDDDLEIMDFTVFEVMLAKLCVPGIRGVSVGFQHHNAISALMESKVDGKSLLFRVINFVSGVPVLKPGKIYLAGLAGPRPQVEGEVDYFNGAIMGFYKTELEHLFNPVLFSLFEDRLGMGEDKVISMSVGLRKKLWFVPHHYFLHPPMVSNYFQNVRSFQCKVMYSRLYVSLVYGSLKKLPAFLIYLHYYYFSFCRICFAVGRRIIHPTTQNVETVKGIFEGIMLTFTRQFKPTKPPTIDWMKHAELDFNSSE